MLIIQWSIIDQLLNSLSSKYGFLKAFVEYDLWAEGDSLPSVAYELSGLLPSVAYELNGLLPNVAYGSDGLLSNVIYRLDGLLPNVAYGPNGLLLGALHALVNFGKLSL